MGEHIQKMKVEYEELKEKYNEFVDFLGSPKFNTLHYEQRFLLKEQKKAMKQYAEILRKRIRLDEQIERETNYLP